MNADEILDKANPCSCGNGGDCPWYRFHNGNHSLTCGYCGHGYFHSDPAKLLDRWNSENPLPELSEDQAWQQAIELAQAGSNDKTFGQAQDELLTKITDQKQLAFNALCAMFVKKTADELPDYGQRVLFWNGTEWIGAYYQNDGYWYYDDESEDINRSQYWLPLPSFNPESED